MSGHSHYATIKRQKETKDAAKGQMFSKLARAIQIAAKTGGGADPNTNYKLRMSIDTARAANMPKDSIERAITKAIGEGNSMEEVTYEGYGPGGIAVLVDSATDNRNRTGQEIKNIFERGGGSLAGPGSVAFNFETEGLIVVKKKDNKDEQMLSLIDLGVEDIQETDTDIEVYTNPAQLGEIREKLLSSGFEIASFEIIKKPKNYQVIEDASLAEKVLNFLDDLEEHDDVQKIFTNIDIPDDVLQAARKNV